MPKAAMRTTLVAAVLSTSAVLSSSSFPDPARDIPVSGGKARTAVFAGGCFWGVEAVFERLQGVSDVVAGFAGGSKATAHYRIVSVGTTGHAEAVRITYEPARLSYGKLLKIFFAVAHDPTELNRQGPDEGTQYRSSIFYATTEEQAVAQAYIQQLNGARVFQRPIVTTVVPLEAFYAAEEYHQDFVVRNPTYPYVVYNDLPKIRRLEQEFPTLLRRVK
jgi:peptide-methionine (S)-S-oxide reductase